MNKGQRGNLVLANLCKHTIRESVFVLVRAMISGFV